MNPFSTWRNHSRFKGLDLLTSVPIDYSQLEVITAADYPILSLNEATGSDRDIGKLEGLDD